MAKKQANARKSSGTAGIATVEDELELDRGLEEIEQEVAEVQAPAPKPGKAGKAKASPSEGGSVGIGEIRKAAAFANSVGGLDKAIALLQILKVAKEVQ